MGFDFTSNMKLLLSRYGGELAPKDRLYSNALHAYAEKYADVLEKHDVPICGTLDISFDAKDLAWISSERDEHYRFEKGFYLVPLGNNLQYETSPYQDQLKTVRNSIVQEHGLQIPSSVLFNYLTVDLTVYAAPRWWAGWAKDSLFCVDKSEPIDSVIKSAIGTQKEIFDYAPAGEIIQVPISLFEEQERHYANSLRKKTNTKSSIILPEHSSYNHFWIDKVT